MRTLFAGLITLSILSTAPAQAVDLRASEQNPLLHNISWEQDELQTQIRNVNYLRSRVEKLEVENEQLRNSIIQMRAGREEQGAAAYDIRLQALIEENKKLANQLALAQSAGSKHPAIPNPYAQRLYLLENENTKLHDQLATIVAQTELKHKKQTDSYEQEISRLKSSLSVKSHKNTDDLLQLQQRISFLESENKRLTTQAGSSNQSYERQNDRALQGKNKEIQTLQNSVASLKTRNAQLSTSLSTQEALIEQYKAAANHSAETKTSSNARITQMQSSISSLKKKNADLTAQVQEHNATLKSQTENSEGIKVLQRQNQSLRETIRAQNEVLKSADNATKTAESLITENRALKVQIKKAGNTQQINNKTVQQLLTRNQILENQLGGKETYIKKLEGLKATVKQLRQENDKYAMGQMSANAMQQKLHKLEDQNAAYQQSLDKERASVIEYRKKIREYQDNINALNLENETTHKDTLQSYQQKVGALEKVKAEQNSTVTQLRLETQDLKAQISLLEQNLTEQKAQLKDVKQSHASELKALEKKNKGKSNVKYIETSYPSVDKVKPLLNENGEHLFDKKDEEVVSPSTVSAEDILSEDLKPLSSLNE